MDNTSPSPSKKGSPKSSNQNPVEVIEPLTRQGCKRLLETERQIVDAINLEPEALIERAQQRDKMVPEFLSAETLVYFIRQAHRNHNRKTRNALLQELMERCVPFFRGKFRGFDNETRKDLQGDVLLKIGEDILAESDRGDYLQVRFWTYLEREQIDAYRKASRRINNTESLDVEDSKGQAKLEKEIDPTLSPEQLAMIAEGLGRLTPDLRRLFILRHYFNWKIGSDNLAEVRSGEPTLAKHFGCSSRTIRNRLREIDNLLSEFRQEENHEK